MVEPDLKYDPDDPDSIEDVKPPPKLLYHYTSPTAFFEIVKSGRLHATHHRFLDDVGEIEFGFKIALDVLRQLRDEIDDEVRPQLKANMTTLLDGDSTFLACLSASHDVLSQWRAYANNGKGYCIGFHPGERRLKHHSDGDDLRSNHLLKCIYGREELEDRLKRLFRRKLERLANKEFEKRDETLASDLSMVALRYAQLAKHEHFREEDEWRYIVHAPPRDIQYRAGALGLTPFLPTEKLTIEEVWIGPGIGPTPELAKRTVTQFLSQHGIEAKVEYWASPYARR